MKVNREKIGNWITYTLICVVLPVAGIIGACSVLGAVKSLACISAEHTIYKQRHRNYHEHGVEHNHPNLEKK